MYFHFISEKDSSFPKGEVVSAIESEYKTCINYFHSFGMTENYYVYVEQPLLINFLKLMKNKVEGKDTNSAIIFYEDIKVTVVDRSEEPVTVPEKPLQNMLILLKYTENFTIKKNESFQIKKI